MTVIDQSTSKTGLGLAQTGASGLNTAKGLQDQFLKLLITQMKNQDPLNPMQNAELTSQLAQISTVEGITNLKNTLLSIGGQIDVSQSMSAVAMIGKGVLVPGSRSRSGWTRRTPRAAWSRLRHRPAEGRRQVQVRISDANGAVIRTMELGEKKVGVYTLDWDGKNDAGVAMEAAPTRCRSPPRTPRARRSPPKC